MLLNIPSPLEKIDIVFKNNIQLYIKRDDLIHLHISGNKWRKLKYNIEDFHQQKKKFLLSVGGAFSNHIMALAAASKIHKIQCIGIIRGEELNINSNKNLAFANEQGMQLFFVERSLYAKKYDDNFIDIIAKKLNINSDDIYFVPEGGANENGAKGCEDIASEININFDYICTACGTGTTLAGIANAISEKQKAVGFSVIGNNYDLENEVKKYCTKNFTILHDFNFGGYAKKNATLLDFIRDFYKQTNIKTDYVYTGKMFYGIFKLIEENYFEPNSKIVAVHTGGILNADIFDEI